MAVAPKPYVRIPSFQQSTPVVDREGRFTPAALRALNDAFQQLGRAINAIAALPEIQAALLQLDQATQAAYDAATAATAATAANAKEQALVNSYIDPSSVLSASPTAITIAPHTRMYADGTSVPVNGGTAPATASGDTDYVSYSDPTRAGGAVTYVVSTDPPTQTSDTHVVGAVAIPTAGTVDGGDGPRRPGYVEAKLAAGNES